MHQNTAMVLRAPDVTGEPLTRFIGALLAAQPADTTSMVGAAVWSPLPIEQVIADGLWPVMMKVAERTGRKLNTELHVQAIEPVVTRLLCAGMYVAYESPEAAARAFRVEILARALNDVRAGDLEHRPWTKPASQFFARLVRAAHEFGQEMEQLTRRYQDLNATASVIADKYVLNEYGWMRWRDLQMTGSPDCYPFYYPHLIETRTLLKANLQLLGVLRKIPFSDKRYKPGTPKQVGSMDDAWISTQILLAAAKRPDADFINNESYGTALAALGNQSDDDISDRVISRIEKRGITFTPPERLLIAGCIADQLKRFRKHPTAGPTNVNLVITAPIKVTNADEALRTITTPGPVLPTNQRSIVEHLDWANMSRKDFNELLMSEMLPLPQILTGLAKIHAPDRQDWMSRDLLASDFKSTELLDGLLRIKFLEPSLDLAEQYPDLVPTDLIREHFFLLYRSMSLPAFLHAVIRMTEKEGKKFFSRVEDRAEFLEVVRNTFFHAPDTLVASLKKTMGPDLWVRFVLIDDILTRELDYAEAEKTTEILQASFPPWDELAPKNKPISGLGKVLFRRLHVTEVYFMDVFRMYREENVLAWFLEGSPNKEQRVDAYVRNRKTYYRRLAELRAKPGV